MDFTSFLWGAAIGVVGAFATGFLKKAGEDCYSWVRKKTNPKTAEQHPPHLIIHMNSETGPPIATGISVSDPQLSVLERISLVTLDEINTAIFEAPPLQRDRVAESYIGLRVEWETKFVGGTLKDDENIRIQLTVPDGKHYSKSVWCEVPSSEYRELGILPEASRVRVTGEIAKIGSSGVVLENVRLHIYGLQRGS